MPSHDPAVSAPGHRTAPSTDGDVSDRSSVTPSALGLARLSPRTGFPPGGEDLYRHILRLIDLGPEDEFVVVPCGRGTASVYLANSTDASGAGADPSEDLVEKATARVRDAGLAGRLHHEHAPLEDLPYKDDVFDVAIGDIGLAAASEPAEAVAELVRVTKPMGTVVLVQPIWTRTVEDERRAMLVEHMGVQPFVLVEWKQMLRDAGVVDLYVEDWSEALGVLRQPFTLRRFVGFFSLRERIAMLYRAWRRWGVHGVREAIQRERKIRRLVAEERVLGVSLIRGVKWSGRGGDEAGADEPSEERAEERAESPADERPDGLPSK